MHPHANPQPGRLRWLAFAVAIAAAVMDLLDSTVAQVAAPAIHRDLGGSDSLIQWVTASYTLAMGVGLLTGGRLGDLYDRKRVLLLGLGAFMLASVASAAAVDPGELIAARAAQGLCGALMVPQVFGLIRDLFPEHEVGKALGVFGGAMGLSAMLGPIVSGGLIDLNLLGSGWRMIFLVNVPVGVLALVGGARLLPASPSRHDSAQLDLRGVVLAGAGMFLLIFPLIEGRQLHWPAWTIVMLAASLATLGAFARYQLQRERRGQTPLVEPAIFRRRAYVAGTAFSLVFTTSLGGVVLIFNVFLQVGLGFSPWHSALSTAPWAVGAFVGSGIGSAVMERIGRRVLQAGLLIEAVGLVGVYGVLRASGTHVGSLELLAPMAVGGAGMGAVFVPLFDIVLAGVSPRETGSASGVLQSINGLGMSLGVAAIGTLVFSLASSGTAHSFVVAAQWAALVCVGLLVSAFVLAFGLPRRARELPAAQPQPAEVTGTAQRTVEPVAA